MDNEYSRYYNSLTTLKTNIELKQSVKKILKKDNVLFQDFVDDCMRELLVAKGIKNIPKKIRKTISIV